ncbi:hypothetical protein [Maribellus luteus]|uniref:hypothetical protein n=1 Tax=Maribellus luteus TaxID=2305463 RepID=UPI0011C3A3FD|nr:hypothetical protein [Maribellus luteus]
MVGYNNPVFILPLVLNFCLNGHQTRLLRQNLAFIRRGFVLLEPIKQNEYKHPAPDFLLPAFFFHKLIFSSNNLAF